MKRTLMICGWLPLLALLACRPVGPGSIPRDRFEFSDAVSESWKRQTLHNIVKLRYLDPPIFMDVGQIVTSHSLETGATLGSTLTLDSGPGSNLTLGGSARYTDRPTVTYTPMTGDKFLKGLVTPLSPDTLFSTIQAGWSSDGVLLTAVAGLNGLKNQNASLEGIKDADPRFRRVAELFRTLQSSGALTLRQERVHSGVPATLLCLHAKDSPDAVELRKLLRLAPDADEYRLVSGPVATKPTELAVQTRSILHILGLMAAHVDIPEEHVAQGRAAVGLTGQSEVLRYARIHSAKSLSPDAFVAVRYRDYWFWVDDRDLKSKRVLSFVMMLFTLTDSGEREGKPILTIPTQ